MDRTEKMHEFDADTIVAPTAAVDVFSATISEGWSVGTAPNGGYLLAIMLKAAALGIADKKVGEFPHPISAHVQFVGRVTPGPVTLRVTVLKLGKQYASTAVTLVQRGQVQVFASTVFGNFDTRKEGKFDHQHLVSPMEKGVLPDKSKLMRNPFALPLYNRVEIRFKEFGLQRYTEWISFKEPRPLDFWALTMFCDVSPPHPMAIVTKGKPAREVAFWFPTVTLDVIFHNAPSGKVEPVICTMETPIAFGDQFEENCVLYDMEGRVLLTARQLGTIVPWAKNVGAQSESKGIPLKSAI